MEVGSKIMKQDYLQQLSKTTFIVGFIASVVLGLIQLRLGVGLFIGLIVGMFNLWMTTNYVDQLMIKTKFVLSFFLFYAVINYGLMILALLLSVIYPNWVSIYMVAIGLVMLKLVMFIKEI